MNRSDNTRRRFAAGLIASVTLLGVAGVPSLAVAATATSTATSWGGQSEGEQSWGGQTWGGQIWGGQSWGGRSDNGETGGGGDGTTTTDSQAATAAESKGVVLIDTVLAYQNAEAAGTGVILTSSGEILTNYHVVEGATKITVTVASTGKTYTAKVVGHDESHDIALLQVRNASGLDPVTIDDDSVAVGDEVTAVGNAGGTGTLTAADGTVTSLTATVTTTAEGTVASETLKSMIETSADVVAGDSGGPLYDDEGEVVGIDTAASTGTEIDGYAIPIDEALTIVDEIRSGDATSSVQIGPSAFLGVLVGEGQGGTGGWQNSGFGLAVEGATISGVVDGSPAAKAGLEAGDVITGIGSHQVSSADQVSELLAKHSVGDKVTITWTGADGSSHHAVVTLAASPVA